MTKERRRRLTPLRALRAYRMALIARTRVEVIGGVPLFEHQAVVDALEEHLEALLVRGRR
jgi:hypothetical protein